MPLLMRSVTPISSFKRQLQTLFHEFIGHLASTLGCPSPLFLPLTVPLIQVLTSGALSSYSFMFITNLPEIAACSFQMIWYLSCVWCNTEASQS